MKFSLSVKFILFFLLFNTYSYGATSTVFVDLDIIINKSIAGTSITNQLNKIKKKEIEKFKKSENEFKIKEKKIISQKNVLSNEEFKKKILVLRNEIKNYNDLRNKIVKDSNQKLFNARAVLLNKLTPILANYSTDKNIDIILPKKNILIGRTELDITNEILEIFNKKIKTIKIN